MYYSEEIQDIVVEYLKEKEFKEDNILNIVLFKLEYKINNLM